jgi:GntR family transcriptional regulator / MocR family aminotransferase
VYDEWRQAILAGRLRPRSRVPSTRALAAALGVSRATITTAYDQLLAEGYLETAHGAGTFISRELPDSGTLPRPIAGRSTTSAAVPRLSPFAHRLDTTFRMPAAPPGAINLSALGPDTEAFPFAIWRRIVAKQLRSPRSEAFTQLTQAAGYVPLRRAIAEHVTRTRAVHCTADQVVVVNGSQQALDLCARVLLCDGDEVTVEDPCYPLARLLFAAHGARLRPARVTSAGIDIAGLARQSRIVFVTPSRQFPTGVSMSLARRLELVEWARRTGAVIIEDDYDSIYRYDGAPLPSLQSLAQGVSVVYVSTFSNVMFPGLRIGYLVAPPDLVAPIVQAKSLCDRQTAVLEQSALATFIRDGELDRHVRRMRRLYRIRRDLLIDALDTTFESRVSIRGRDAGMHLFATFAERDIAARAARSGVHLTSAAPYYMNKRPDNEFLIGFSAVSERTIREGLRRLREGLSIRRSSLSPRAPGPRPTAV